MTPKLWLSLQVAGVATAGGLALGIWLAYRLATGETLGRKLLLGALAILWAAPLILLARLLLLPMIPWHQAGAAAGMLTAMSVIVLGSRHRMAAVNRDYGNASRSLGCSEWRIFWRVVAPLAWNAMLASAALAFLRVWLEWSIFNAL
jgi:ABC-type spermidine/putrescine transport system permease subunit II